MSATLGFVDPYSGESIDNNNKVNKEANTSVGFVDPYSGKTIDDTPQSIQKAEDYMNNSKDQSYYNGYCQAFVEDMANNGGYDGGSAIEAWYNHLAKGDAVADPTLKGIKKGDLVYFDAAPSNASPDYPNGAGHTGIFKDNNTFISATENADKVVQPNDVKKWSNDQQQPILGYVSMH
jgi:hypothetical protein